MARKYLRIACFQLNGTFNKVGSKINLGKTRGMSNSGVNVSTDDVVLENADETWKKRQGYDTCKLPVATCSLETMVLTEKSAPNLRVK